MIKINFVINLHRPNQYGEVPIAITLSRKSGRLQSTATGLKVKPECWNGKTKKATEEYQYINVQLDRIVSKIREIESQFILADQTSYTPQDIWKVFKGEAKAPENIANILKEESKMRNRAEKPMIEIIQEHIEFKINRGMIKTTDKKTHKTVINKIAYFLESKDIANIGYNRFDYSLFEEMVTFMRNHRFNRKKVYKAEDNVVKNSHLNRLIQTVRAANKYALKKGYTKTLIPEMDSLKLDAQSTEFLTMKELRALEQLDVSKSKAYEAVKDVFLFSCYTGFLWSDMTAFEPKLHLETDDKEKTWIIKPREKTGTKQILPLLPKAQNILEKWDYQLPLGCEQVHNRTIKVLTRLAGIHKRISNRCARKTAGMLWLDAGVSIEVVATMLGHKDVRITQRHYAQIQRSRLERETEKLLQMEQETPKTTDVSEQKQVITPEVANFLKTFNDVLQQMNQQKTA
ncbi:MAG: site-specific integrase [Raineya sp.]|jgi:integrase|nr:site-specific integrase [Raineya sp.]